jgi:hypothetical protein
MQTCWRCLYLPNVPPRQDGDAALVLPDSIKLDESTETLTTKSLKRKYFDLEENRLLAPCSNGTNQVWDEFAKCEYVFTAVLSGGKQCIDEVRGKVYVLDCLSKNRFVQK